jgi:hypothetical protein
MYPEIMVIKSGSFVLSKLLILFKTQETKWTERHTVGTNWAQRILPNLSLEKM